MNLTFLRALAVVLGVCGLWLWIMAQAVSAGEAFRRQYLRLTTPRRRVGDRGLSEAQAQQVFEAIVRAR